LGAKALEFQVMTRYAESRSPLDLDRQARGQAHLQVGNASAILAYDMMVVVVLSRFRRASGFARRVMPEQRVKGFPGSGQAELFQKPRDAEIG
jgi:hypothetical protein